MEKKVIIGSNNDVVGEEAGTNEQQAATEIDNPEWIPTGKLGPFTVAESVEPGTFTVIQCFAFQENERHLVRFDPPSGLAFGIHNQTESGFIFFSTLKGKVDLKNLPEVSCRTLAAPRSSERSEASARQQRIHPSSVGAVAATGALNSSQLTFLLMVLSVGAYYLYTVHILPKLPAASRQYQSKLKSILAATGYSSKNKDDNHHQQSRNRKNKGGKGPSRAKKSGGGKKKQPGRANTSVDVDTCHRSASLPSNHSKHELLNRVQAPNSRFFSLSPLNSNHERRLDKSAAESVEPTSRRIAADSTDVVAVEQNSSNLTTSGLISSASVDALDSKGQNTKEIIKKPLHVGESEQAIDRELTHEVIAQTEAGDGDGDGYSTSTRLPNENNPNSEGIEKMENKAAAAAAINEDGSEIDERVAAKIATEKMMQRKVDDDINATTDCVKGQQQNLGGDPLEELPSTIKMYEESEAFTEELNPVIGAKKAAEQKGIPTESDSIPMAVYPSPLAPASANADSASSSSPILISKPTSINIIVLQIEGMTCGGCVTVVNRILNSFDEIDSVVTDLKTCTSTLSCNVPRVNLLPILTGLDDVGMQAYLQSQSPSASEVPTTATTSVSCPVKEQQTRQQTLGAIGQKNPDFEIGATITNSTSTNPLSLMDELRVGSTPLRRYQCSCGCEGCICSASQIHANDDGREISLSDLCNRLETTLGTTRLEETFRETGGSPELRDKILQLSFPCGCSTSETEDINQSINR